MDKKVGSKRPGICAGVEGEDLRTLVSGSLEGTCKD